VTALSEAQLRADPGAPGEESRSQLEEAFRVFTEASAKFEEHYARLEKRIAELNLELEEANGKLREHLEEKQRVYDYLTTLLESLPVGVIGLDPDGRIRSCNRRAAEILGVDSALTQRRNVLEVLEWDGRTVQDPHGNPLRLEADPLAGATGGCEKAGDAGHSFEILFSGSGAPRRRFLRLQAVPTGDCGTASVVLIEDVTEMRRLEQQANRNSRLAAMGEIAMNVAHEIRNPLGSIELFASMLQRDLSEDARNSGLAAHICTGVRCVDHIVSNILQFARPQRLVCSSFDLKDLIEETLLFAEHALKQKGIRVERGYGKSPASIYADAELLKQMFLNLFLNAIHATGEGGALGVEVQPTPGAFEVRVWDTGRGLAPEIIGRIFDPFFTTRRKGTGLGLTIVHNIVSVHHGSIEADNRPEGGAVFSIVLPRNCGVPIES